MKIRLNDGTELEVMSISYSYATSDPNQNANNAYAISIPISDQPVKQVNEIVALFSIPGNISKITAIGSALAAGDSDLTEFEFTEFVGIYMNVDGNGKTINVSVR